MSKDYKKMFLGRAKKESAPLPFD